MAGIDTFEPSAEMAGQMVGAETFSRGCGLGEGVFTNGAREGVQAFSRGVESGCDAFIQGVTFATSQLSNCETLDEFQATIAKLREAVK